MNIQEIQKICDERHGWRSLFNEYGVDPSYSTLINFKQWAMEEIETLIFALVDCKGFEWSDNKIIAERENE